MTHHRPSASPSSPGVFGEWQPRYAEVEIPSFPVAGKVPGVRGYARIGLKGSRELALKHGAAPAFGISLQRAGLTVLDVDTPDERVLADALDRHGRTPFIVRSGGSGNWQAWYRNSGEERRIRPEPWRPIDILGAGFIVAPPSKGDAGAYELVQGRLEDLPDLPAMRRLETGLQQPQDARAGAAPGLPDVADGKRNDALWRHLMRQAPHCDDLDALVDVARTDAAVFSSPLPDEEIVRAARSAWSYEERGENHIGHPRRLPPPSEPDGLLFAAPDAFMLWKVLQHFNGGRRQFYIANAMHQTMPTESGKRGWKRERFTAARKVLLATGHIREVSPARGIRAGLYAWSEPSR